MTFMVAKCPAMPAPFVLDLFEDVMLKGAFREPRPELIEWGYVLRAHWVLCAWSECSMPDVQRVFQEDAPDCT